MKRKAVVLLSGGLDSTVCLWWARQKKWNCVGLNFDYGQRHSKEQKIAKKIARRAGIPLTTVRFELPWSRSSLTEKKKKLPNNKLKNIGRGSIPSTYVPARNTIFLSFAMSLADEIRATSIVIGANAIDYSGYPDCRPNYLSAFGHVASLGSRTGSDFKKTINVVAPLIKLTKADIIRLGHRLKAPIKMTWSCYKGGRKPCGQCDSCLLREKGFKEAALN